jgi:hypothetical protein
MNDEMKKGALNPALLIPLTPLKEILAGKYYFAYPEALQWFDRP